MPANFAEILSYWFGTIEESEAYLSQRGALWFGGDPATDQEIREKFEYAVELAAAAKLDPWRESPLSCLALIILLDQFPLNIYRNEAKGYELGDMAVPVALQALERGFASAYHPVQKAFLYLPLEHSEDLSHQKQAVELFTALCEETKETFWSGWAQGSLDWAVRHLVVIERFGRFPHRNLALGRPSTPEEIEFLRAGNPF